MLGAGRCGGRTGIAASDALLFHILIADHTAESIAVVLRGDHHLSVLVGMAGVRGVLQGLRAVCDRGASVVSEIDFVLSRTTK